jgi:citrate lyase subunit beta/citryl-CoA lyase
MAPDYSEVQVASDILLKAQDADWGPIQHDGELHDRATYRYFWELVQKAKVTGLKLSDDVLKRFFA